MPKYSYFTILAIAVLLSTTWLTSAILVRTTDLVYLPLAGRFLIGATTLFFIPVIFLRRMPQTSLRLLHASLSVSVLVYFLSPLLVVVSLNTLPSGMAALVMCSAPLWLSLLARGVQLNKLPNYLLLVMGLLSFLVGCWELAAERGNPVYALLFLAFACLSQVLGIWMSRRLFWLHSALDLNFWAMTLAGVAHLILALVHGELAKVPTLGKEVWVVMAWLGLMATGCAAYLYRVESMVRNTLVLLTMLVPTLSLLVGFSAMGETPLNGFTLGGTLLVLFVLAKEGIRAIPAHWMTLLLNNDRRQGDRLVCLLDGYLKKQGDTATAKVQITNLSIGGIGFRLDRQIAGKDRILLTLPMGQNWTSVTLEGVVAHVKKGGTMEFPYSGGIEFQNLSGFRRQCVVEFLARVSRAEEEEGYVNERSA